MRILLVEDDFIQAQLVTELFEGKFKKTEVRRIGTESQFLSEFDEIEKWLPDLIILDVMVRWEDPSPEVAEAPKEIKEGGFRQAGFRCLEKISCSPTLFNVPVIIYSVLASIAHGSLLRELPPHVFIIGKETDPDQLLQFAESVVAVPPEDNPASSGILDRLVKSVELKPGWFGLRIDLKSLFGRENKE